MYNLKKTIETEILKMRKSNIFWITIIAFSFITIVIAIMMFILKEPELAQKTGLLGDKAQIIGEANWESYFEILSQIIAIGGLIGYGFITSWIFGREFVDNTVEDILAIPTSKMTIVTAKIIVMFCWSLFLSTLVLIIGLFAGYIVGLSDYTYIILFKGIKLFLNTTILTMLLSTLVAFFASFGKGYLSPMGYVIFTIVISQFLAALGHGAYIPWAIPALYSGAAGPQQADLHIISFIIVIATSIIGYLFTLIWWERADFN